MKQKYASLLLIAICWSAATLCAQAPKDPGPTAKPVLTNRNKGATTATAKGLATVPALQPNRVVVTYFYTDVRCPSCIKIETYAKEAVERDFASGLKSGTVEWRAINTDTRGNEHFLTDYQLFTKSVIVSQITGGKEDRWKNLPEVWPLLGKKAKFQDYVTREVRAYTEAR